MMRLAVVGHVEWIEFVRVPYVPAPGEIVHASERWQTVGGGGAIVAVDLVRLGAEVTLYTALGDDRLGHRALDELGSHGVRVESTFRPEAQRRCFVFVDDDHERTITVIGDRMGPHAGDPLAWNDLAGTDGVYFTAGDDDALRHARDARVLVATSRVFEQLAAAEVPLDAVVGSGRDTGERYVPGWIHPEPPLVVMTEGESGGRYVLNGEEHRFPAAKLPGPVVDAYGCGDAFAAGLTYGLSANLALEAALDLAARCGAATLTGRGPYEAPLPAPPS
jgi:ribokinase